MLDVPGSLLGCYSIAGWATMETLTERTDEKRRKGYIAAATAEGKATLLTRAYGRGIVLVSAMSCVLNHACIVRDIHEMSLIEG